MFNELLSNPVWHYEFFGNTVAKYTAAAGMFLVFLSGLTLLRMFILRVLERIIERTETDIDDAFTKIVASVRPIFFIFLGIYFAAQTVELSEQAAEILDGILFAWIVYQVVLAIQIVIDYIVERKIQAQQEAGKPNRAATHVIVLIVKIMLWALGLVLILSNFGVNVTSLVAGLGIGGIAIALAAQNILGELFSSFSIYADKPFQPGDFIVVGDKKGTVKSVGMKSTRIKALQGEEIIVPNKELTNATIQNFKKLQERRIDFTIGVTYETPNEKLRMVPKMMEEIISSFENLRFDRAHFRTFGDFALIFEIVYFVESASYREYIDAQQEINFKIREAFEKEGIEMAYPTQTLHVRAAQAPEQASLMFSSETQAPAISARRRRSQPAVSN